MSAGNRLSDSTRPRPALPLASEPKLSGIPVNQSLSSPQQPVSYRECENCACECIPYSWKIWWFGGLYYNHQIKICQNFLLAYIRMATPYQTTKFKSTNILAITILGSTAKFNSRQYFRLYGNIIIEVLTQVAPYQHTVDELIRGVEYPAKVVFTGRSSM